MRSKLKVNNRALKIIRSYKNREALCPYPPLRIWIEPTNVCNLKCKMCPTTYIKEDKKGFMKLESFKSIIDRVKDYVFDVFLLLGGEPLLHRQILEMIEYCYKNGIRSMIHSNATVLDGKMSYSLINSGLDLISFSFDGYDKQTYERIRKNANYEKTLSNILDFLRMKKRLKSKKPYVIIQNILFNDIGYSSKDKERFLRNFSYLPVDEFRDVYSDNRGGFFFENINFKTTLPTSKNMGACPFIWYSLSILWDGKIVPCCMDFEGKYLLGNIAEDNLLSVWNGERLATLRKRMKEGNLNKLDNCYNCDILWQKRKTNIPLDFLFTLNEGTIGYRILRYFHHGLRFVKNVFPGEEIDL